MKKQITAVDKTELEKAMKDTLGIMETGGVGYISGIPGGKIKDEMDNYDREDKDEHDSEK